MAEDLRLRQVEPGNRVKGVGVGRGNGPEVGRRIALDVGELPHRRMHSLDCGHITHLHPRHLGGD